MALDVDGLDEVAAAFGAAGLRAVVNLHKAGEVFGARVKKVWRALDSGLQHAPAYPYSIGYDVHLSPTEVEVEIGPDKDKPQGALGNLIEFGSAHNPPHGSGARALALAAGDLERGVTLALEQAL